MCEPETAKVLPTGVRNQLLLNGGVRDDPQVTQEAAVARGTAAAETNAHRAEAETVSDCKGASEDQTGWPDSGPLATHTFICVYIQSVGNVYSMHTHNIYIQTQHTRAYACFEHSRHFS